MFKLKKLLCSLIATVFLCSNFAYASESLVVSQSDGTTNIKLDEIQVNIPYDSNEIQVDFNKNENQTTAIIVDKVTNEKLCEYTELKDNENNNLERGNSDTYYRTLSRKNYVGPASVETCVRIKIYSSGSFRQIDSLEECWQKEGGSGPYTLEATRTYCNSSFPNSKVSINASGNVVVSSTSSITTEFSYESLTRCGFSVSGSSSSNWHARQGYNFDLTFSLY